MAQRLTGRNPRSYIGVEPLSPPNSVWFDRSPTTGDYAEFNIGDFWLRKNTNEVWILIDKKYFIATWIMLGAGGGGGGLLTITGNAGGAVAGDLARNINEIGEGILTNLGNPGLNTLTMGFIPGGDGQIIIGRNLIQPVWGNLTSNTIDVIEGPGTLSIELLDVYIKEIDTAGGNILPNAGGIVNFTSVGGSIVFNGVGNTLNLEAPGVGGTVTVVTGDRNITISSNPNLTPNVRLDQSVIQPVTNLAGTTGVYALGVTGYDADRFLHAGGGITNTFTGSASGNLTNTSVNSSGYGFAALQGLTNGNYNMAIGTYAQTAVTSGAANSSIGVQSLYQLLTGNFNIGIGYQSGSSYTTNESSNILLSHAGVITEDNTIHIGTQGNANGQQNRFFAAGVFQVAPPNTYEVTITDNVGQFGTITGNTNTVLSGTTAGSPIFRTLISPGATITINTVGNQIQLESVAGGAGTVTIVEGSNNITITQNPNVNPKVNLNTSILQPFTTASPGNSGVYALGVTDYVTDRFLHGYGLNGLNTFVGRQSGNLTLNNLVSTENTVVGARAGQGITTASNNTFVGSLSGQAVTVGDNNTMLGYGSGTFLVSGTRNLLLGLNSGTNYTTNESNNILLSNNGTVLDTNTTRIGTEGGGAGQQDKFFAAGIYPVAANGTYKATMTKSDGQVFTLTNGAANQVLTINGGVPTWQNSVGGGTVTVVTGTNNITITGNPNLTPNVQLDPSILQPATNVGGTTGVYALGLVSYDSDRFLHAAGAISNTFVGRRSGNTLVTNTGTNNTGIGQQTMLSVTSGSNNSTLGGSTLFSLTTGSRNLVLGASGGSTYTGAESNNILLSSAGVIAESNTIHIGTEGAGAGQQNRFFAAGIYPVAANGTYRVTMTKDDGQVFTLANGAANTILTINGGVPTWQAGGGGGAVLPGKNINIAPAQTVNVNDSVHVLATNNLGTTGVFAIGNTAYPNALTDRFLHGYGTRNAFGGYQAGNMTLTVGTAVNNTGFGYRALLGLTTGPRNTGFGAFSGINITTGTDNTFHGYDSGVSVTTGDFNTFVGSGAGGIITSDDSNVIIGYNAANGARAGATVANVIIGTFGAQTSIEGVANVLIGHNVAPDINGSRNIIIGENAGLNLGPGSVSNSNIYISNPGVFGEDNTIRIGDEGSGTSQQNRAFMAGIYPVAPTGSFRLVTVNSASQLKALAAGSNGDVLTTTGGNIVWQAASPSSGAHLRTNFSSSGTWNKDSDAIWITVYGWNGGSGGGGAACSPTSGGGGGGGAGGCFEYSAPASFFNAAENVIIGAGGAGGIGEASPAVATPGAVGGQTSFGFLSVPLPATGGMQGTIALPGTGGPSGQVFTSGFSVVVPAASCPAGGTGGVHDVAGNNGAVGGTTLNTFLSATGGGGGAGINSSTGGDGGNIRNVGNTITVLAGGAGAAVLGGTGNVGTASGPASHGFVTGGTGGGGGAGSSVGVGGSGGAGGLYGAGGGGGGGSPTGSRGGHGGAGSQGYIIVIEHLAS